MDEEIIIGDKLESQLESKQEKDEDVSESGILSQEQIYSEQDLATWEKGSESYKSFIKNVERIETYSKHEIGSIQAMFLGEKPAVLKNKLAFEHKKDLENFGFKFTNNYCYKPDLIQNIIEKYKNKVDFSSNTPDVLMNELDEARLEDHSIIKGLILGFPLAVAEDFDNASKFESRKVIKALYDILPQNEKDFLEVNFYTEKIQGNQEIFEWVINKLVVLKKELNISEDDLPKLTDEIRSLINAKTVNIHGVIWTDYQYSSESRTKQERLAKAFESSGILD